MLSFKNQISGRVVELPAENLQGHLKNLSVSYLKEAGSEIVIGELVRKYLVPVDNSPSKN